MLRKLISNYLLLIVSFMALCVMSEIGLRLTYSDRLNSIERISWMDIGNCVVYPSGEMLRNGFSAHPDEKAGKTYRIFVFGGSSVHGYPFKGGINIPSWMSRYLTDIYPDRNIEVINCGSTGADTTSWGHLFFDALKYSPDAMVVYAGHNNFVGPTISRKLPVSTKFKKLVTRLYMVRLIKAAIRNAFANKKPVQPGEHFERICDAFVSHVEQMLQATEKKNIPLIISTIQSNMSGWHPGLDDLNSYCMSHDTSEDISENKYICEAKKYIDEGDCGQAVITLKKHTELFNKSWPFALASFYEGMCLERLGDYSEAMEAYQEAVDNDFYRHRAPHEFNERIKTLEGKYENITIIDSSAEIIKHAKNGIPGGDMFVDHVHPNPRGQRIIAMALVKGIVESGVIEGEAEWSLLRSDDEYDEAMEISENETDNIELSFCFRLFEQRHFVLALKCYEKLSPERIRFSEAALAPILMIIEGREEEARTTFSSLVSDYGQSIYSEQDIESAFEKLKESVGENGRSIRNDWPEELRSLPAPDFKSYLQRITGLKFK